METLRSDSLMRVHQAICIIWQVQTLILRILLVKKLSCHESPENKSVESLLCQERWLTVLPICVLFGTSLWSCWLQPYVSKGEREEPVSQCQWLEAVQSYHLVCLLLPVALWIPSVRLKKIVWGHLGGECFCWSSFHPYWKLRASGHMGRGPKDTRGDGQSRVSATIAFCWGRNLGGFLFEKTACQMGNHFPKYSEYN